MDGRSPGRQSGWEGAEGSHHADLGPARLSLAVVMVMEAAAVAAAAHTDRKAVGRQHSKAGPWAQRWW